MNKTVAAIYEAGSLQLLESVELPDATRVQVQISNLVAENGYQQADSFRRCLENIRALLLKAEMHWSVDLVRQSLPPILRNELRTLWYLCEPSQRKLCAMLELSVKQMDETQLTVQQVAVVQYGLDLLENAAPTELEVKNYRRQLIDVGLPPRFTLDQSVVQHYVDER